MHEHVAVDQLEGQLDGVAPSDGVLVNLKGNDLPNAPKRTISLGAQYAFMLDEDWEMTIRGDYYYQSSTYTRIYNTEADKLRSWDNVNFTVTLENEASGWKVEKSTIVTNTWR